QAHPPVLISRYLDRERAGDDAPDGQLSATVPRRRADAAAVGRGSLAGSPVRTVTAAVGETPDRGRRPPGAGRATGRPAPAGRSAHGSDQPRLTRPWSAELAKPTQALDDAADRTPPGRRPRARLCAQPE